MIMMVSIAHVLAAAAQSTETGLTNLPSNTDTRCFTTGKGATEVTINNKRSQDFKFYHSRYADGSSVNQSSPDGNVNAGDLSISQTQEYSGELANGSASFCFRTVINVHLALTRCKTIGWRTRFRINGVDKFVYYGNATIARREYMGSQLAVGKSVDKVVRIIGLIGISEVHKTL